MNNFSNNTNGIKRIAILGGGVSGWTVAAALASALHQMRIDIVLIDGASPTEKYLHCEATTPACVAFHQMLGIPEQDLMTSTGASFLLATQFKAWSDQQQNYFMPCSDHGFMLNRIEFPQYAISRYLQGNQVAYDDYSLAAVAAKTGRFCHPAVKKNSLFSTLNYSLTLNTQAYANYLRRFSQKLGVGHVIANVSTLKLNKNGYIESITLKDFEDHAAVSWFDIDGVVSADFYIDCTGVQGHIIDKALHVAWQTHLSQLPVTHVINHVQPITSAQAIPSHRELLTAESGWIQNLCSQTHAEQQYFYHSGFTSADQARAAIGAAGSAQAKPISIGRRETFWYKNCVAIGESAGSLDVLGAGKLHLVQSAALRFISLFPSHTEAVFNSAEYNRLTHLEYDHIEDFHVLHYQLAATQDTAYWQQIARVTLSDRLLHKLELFKARGLVSFYEGETFSAGVWTSLLLGNGYWPQCYDPLIQSMDSQWIEQQLDKMKNMIRSAAEAMPTQSAYLYKQNLTAGSDVRSATNNN